nr:hypothetical protein BaRGS_003800 [Batillaria attramentaria]
MAHTAVKQRARRSGTASYSPTQWRGLMIGVMATALVQSSSTATSIVVALVASEVIPLKAGIPIIMGTNIGTSITNTIVALAQAADRDQFRRAFAGATVHDMFNWLAVLILLPLEVATHYLYYLTAAILSSMDMSSEGGDMEILTAITKPFINLIVQVKSDAITDIAVARNNTDTRVLKRWCNRQTLTVNHTTTHFNPVDIRCAEQPFGSVFFNACLAADYPDTAVFAISWNTTKEINITTQGERCTCITCTGKLFLCWGVSICSPSRTGGDGAVGGVLLAVAFIIIITSLFSIVKILNSLLQGKVAKVISKTINKNLPGKAAYFTDYLALAVGGPYMKDALQIALCHLFFNVSGTLLFFPIPFTRIPIPMAKLLGRTTARYRWFAFFYLLFMFIVFPATVFGLSYAGWQYLAGIVYLHCVLQFLVWK